MLYNDELGYTEPIQYDVVYHYSGWQKPLFITLIAVAFLSGVALAFLYAMQIAVILWVIGAAMIVLSYNEITDKEPRLKLSRHGIWTRKLGFLPWESIKDTIIEDKTNNGKAQLNIFLKDNASDKPDDTLNISNLKNTSHVGVMIDDLKLLWSTIETAKEQV